MWVLLRAPGGPRILSLSDLIAVLPQITIICTVKTFLSIGKNLNQVITKLHSIYLLGVNKRAALRESSTLVDLILLFHQMEVPTKQHRQRS
jgi:hypothetical protein